MTLTLPPLHCISPISPFVHRAGPKKRCLFSPPPSSLPFSHSWNTVRWCKGAIFTRNYPPSITRHGIRGQALARPPFRPTVTGGNYVLPGPLNRSGALGVEIEAPWWNSALVVNAQRPDVELLQPSDSDTFRHCAIKWKSLAWLCLNRMHLVCPAACPRVKQPPDLWEDGVRVGGHAACLEVTPCTLCWDITSAS